MLLSEAELRNLVDDQIEERFGGDVWAAWCWYGERLLDKIGELHTVKYWVQLTVEQMKECNQREDGDRLRALMALRVMRAAAAEDPLGQGWYLAWDEAVKVLEASMGD